MSGSDSAVNSPSVSLMYMSFRTSLARGMGVGVSSGSWKDAKALGEVEGLVCAESQGGVHFLGLSVVSYYS